MSEIVAERPAATATVTRVASGPRPVRRGPLVAKIVLVALAMTTALLPQIDADKMMTSPVSWASNLLASKYIVTAGTPYSVEMIDGADEQVQRHRCRPVQGA